MARTLSRLPRGWQVQDAVIRHRTFARERLTETRAEHPRARLLHVSSAASGLEVVHVIAIPKED
jgi:hypothetical protein